MYYIIIFKMKQKDMEAPKETDNYTFKEYIRFKNNTCYTEEKINASLNRILSRINC